MTRVTLLVAANGRVSSIYADRADAEAKRDRWNADPFLEPGLADPDAPYTVETWEVREVTSERRAP